MSRITKPGRKRDTAEYLRKQAFTALAERYARDHEGASLPDAVVGSPAIASLLKSAKGGWNSVLEALRHYDDPEAQRFVTYWDALPASQQTHVPLEAIAVASSIGCVRLRELAFSAVCDYGQDATRLILATAMPEIVRKSAAMATKTAGFADREWMLKAGAVLPTPKGSQVAIQQNFSLPKPETPEHGGQPALPPWNQEAALRAVYEAQGEPAPHSAALPVLDATVITTMQEDSVDALDGVR